MRRSILYKVLAVLIWGLIVFFGFYVRENTHPLLEKGAEILLSFSFIEAVMSFISILGYQSVTPLWLSSKIYFCLNLTVNFFVVRLFFNNDRKISWVTFWGMLAVIIYSVMVSVIGKFTGNFTFEKHAYQVLSKVISPIAPFLFIPIFYLYERLNSQAPQEA